MRLIQGDCHKELEELDTGSVDLCLTDPPYNTTAAEWDQQPLRWNHLWEQLHRIGRQETPFVFTATQPFTHRLISSNFDNFRYTLVWEKAIPSGAINAKRKPMPKHEDVVVFYRSAGAFNHGAEKMDNPKKIIRRKENKESVYMIDETGVQTEEGHKTSVLEHGRNQAKGLHHPTEKPVSLLKELIEMYSDEGETVLDFTAGSFSTGVAAVQEGRDFIGIEQDEEYYEIGKERVENAERKQEQINKFFRTTE